MIPKKYELLLFALLMSGFMSFLMSGVISFINVGLVENFINIWGSAFLKAYIVAFPSVVVVVPLVRKLVGKLIE